MSAFFRKIFSHGRKSIDPLGEANQLQELRLELSDKDRIIRSLQQEVEIMRSHSETQAQAAVQNQLETLIADIAQPLGSLLAQRNLVEREQKPVQTADIFRVVSSLLNALQRHGMKFIDTDGGQTPYNPRIHFPLSQETAFSPGEAVVIRLPGCIYNEKVVRKAGVEKSS